MHGPLRPVDDTNNSSRCAIKLSEVCAFVGVNQYSTPFSDGFSARSRGICMGTIVQVLNVIIT